MSQDYSDEMEEVKRQFDKKVVRKGVGEDDEEDEETENYSNRYKKNNTFRQSRQGASQNLYDEMNDFADLASENQDNDEEDSGLNQDIELIIKVITQEKYCPDIILYQQTIVDDLFELLQNQEMQIKDIEKSINDDKKYQLPKNKFLQDLMKEECERVKFLIKLYTRTRLYKIQKYYMNIIKHSKYEYLNIQEKDFVKDYAAHRQSIFHNHILNKLPQNFRDIGIESEDNESNSQVQKQSFEKIFNFKMGLLLQIEIDVPNLDKVVFVKFKEPGTYDIDGEQLQGLFLSLEQLLMIKLVYLIIRKVDAGEIIMVPYRHIKLELFFQNLNL